MLQDRIIRKHLGKSIEIFETDWKVGCIGIHAQLFDAVETFSLVITKLVSLIPLGFSREEDRQYELACR